MKKAAIFILIITFILTSCNKSIYYAYESDEFGYCTLELSPIKDRYSSNRYKVFYRSARYGNFLLIETEDWFNKDTTEYSAVQFNFCYSFTTTINEREYQTDQKNGHKYSFIPICCDSPLSCDSSLIYMKESGKEDLTLLRYKLFNDETGLIENKNLNKIGIYNFPPTMSKVDKIDYSKFSKVIPKKLLKRNFY